MGRVAGSYGVRGWVKVAPTISSWSTGWVSTPAAFSTATTPSSEAVASPSLTRASPLVAEAGSGAEEARQVADNLVLSNLMGHDSHGVMRVSQYCQAIADGELDPPVGNGPHEIDPATRAVVLIARFEIGRQPLAIGLSRAGAGWRDYTLRFTTVPLATGMLTSARGSLSRRTLKFTLPPASVVLGPLRADTITLAVSSSMFVGLRVAVNVL